MQMLGPGSGITSKSDKWKLKTSPQTASNPFINKNRSSSSVIPTGREAPPLFDSCSWSPHQGTFKNVASSKPPCLGRHVLLSRARGDCTPLSLLGMEEPTLSSVRSRNQNRRLTELCNVSALHAHRLQRESQSSIFPVKSRPLIGM
jgi:hypothetical protein